jgi:maltose O-acetyltransferase
MLAGELYDAGDPELVAARNESARLMRSVDEQPGGPARTAALRQLLGAFGDGSDIRSPFFCDYGFNISIGARVFVNFNCVFLDVASITIGDRVLIGPAVQLLSADHPVDPGVRVGGLENGRPIVIEDDAWLGGGAIVCPGVTLGRGSVIGAGSVVTRDVPAGVLAVGSPCRVVRELS